MVEAPELSPQPAPRAPHPTPSRTVGTVTDVLLGLGLLSLIGIATLVGVFCNAMALWSNSEDARRDLGRFAWWLVVVLAVAVAIAVLAARKGARWTARIHFGASGVLALLLLLAAGPLTAPPNVALAYRPVTVCPSGG
ncbi:DUF6234 family protein [Kitasatospora viridis]|uniref:Uncharacterized protein n=1 Tax=Kitasatospora viridis TaxID=281105 RepID=A0A561UAG8_9ACTN|nr:DUF6234 family protein [Kitasatospora viridis]TWF96355.1 hypothetical protein FHX73_11119 [Kitasatospora viridis]